MKMELGKLPLDLLERYVLGRRGAESEKVLIGPKLGVDVGIVEVDGRYMVSSIDPITGTPERIGWLSIHIAANDVATSGAEPKYVLSTILLPEGADEDMLNAILEDMDRAARELNISILGGHTEVTPKLDRPIVIATCIGFADSFVTSANARDGDVILMTKRAGIEGTAVIASTYRHILEKMGFKEIEEAERLFNEISVVRDALIAYNAGGVNAMHDPTEGGILGGVYEMSLASELGFVIYEDRIPVYGVTRKLCSVLNINPLKLLGSGSLLVSAKPEMADKVIQALKNHGIEVAEIGRFTKKGRVVVDKRGRKLKVEPPIKDELWRIEEIIPLP